MPSLTPDETTNLRIENFIFHVVHHGQPDAILMDETPIGSFEQFFLDRVSETVSGNRYAFVPTSSTLTALRAIAATRSQFVPQSKILAREFHGDNDQRIKRGVLIVMLLRTGTRRFFSLIKYDHERVVSFDVKNAKAIMQAVVNSFTESPKALQKSALIELTSIGGDVVVIDRKKRTGITDFFRDFLGIDRVFSQAELTAGLQKCVVQTVAKHADDLPAEITSRAYQRLSETAARRPTFNTDEFVAEFFGPYASDAVKATFARELAQRSMTGEAFEYDPSILSAPGPARYRTNEGVRLIIPDSAKDTVTTTTTTGGEITITIRTSKLTPL